MARVKGSFALLKQLQKAVQRADSPEFEAALARGLGAAAMKQLADGFRKGRDPYGKKWKPLKLRRGKPLMDTGRMRASAAVIPKPRGFELVITAEYAGTHQHGKTIRPVRARFLAWKVRGKKGWFFARKVTVPRRQMLPERKTGGLGPIWRKAFQKESKKQVRAHFKVKRGGGGE